MVKWAQLGALVPRDFPGQRETQVTKESPDQRVKLVPMAMRVNRGKLERGVSQDLPERMDLKGKTESRAIPAMRALEARGEIEVMAECGAQPEVPALLESTACWGLRGRKGNVDNKVGQEERERRARRGLQGSRASAESEGDQETRGRRECAGRGEPRDLVE